MLETCSYSNRYALYTHKLVGFGFLHLKAQLYCLANSSHEYIQRFGLGMTASKRGYGSYEVSIRISLYYNVEFLHHVLYLQEQLYHQQQILALPIQPIRLLREVLL